MSKVRVVRQEEIYELKRIKAIRISGRKRGVDRIFHQVTPEDVQVELTNVEQVCFINILQMW